MKTFARTLFETVAVLAAGAVIGFTANQLRGSGSIDLHKNYVDFSIPAEKMAKLRPALEPPTGGGEQPKETAPAPTGEDHPKHKFQTLTFEQVEDLFADPATGEGLNMFLDARKDDLFAEGHIPNAIQCDPYRLEEFIESVQEQIGGAAKVIIYCGGGDCTDSILLCKEMVMNYDVPMEKLFLFEGGWKEWTSQGMPAETGGGD